MSKADLGKLACRHCRYYRVEGRRGGYCQLLCGRVRGIWPACSFVILPFAPSWEALENTIRTQPQLLQK